MALVAFHIHVDNLIVDAVNIVTMDLFLISQRYFIATIAAYIYFSRPRVSLHDISNQASLILEDKMHSFTPGIGQP
jgi:hypothetical protein